jgi:hypothetical protein
MVVQCARVVVIQGFRTFSFLDRLAASLGTERWPKPNLLLLFDKERLKHHGPWVRVS